MTFLEKLDQLMAREHLNRRTLSRKAGIPYTTIDNWYQRGYEGLKLSTAGKLADFFGTTADYFLREELTDPNYGKAAGFQVDFPESSPSPKVPDTGRLRQKRGRRRAGRGIRPHDPHLPAGGAGLGDLHPSVRPGGLRRHRRAAGGLHLHHQAGDPHPAGTGKRRLLPAGQRRTAWNPPIRDGDIVFVQRVENGESAGGRSGHFQPQRRVDTSSSWAIEQLVSFNPQVSSHCHRDLTTGWSVRAGCWESCNGCWACGNGTVSLPTHMQICRLSNAESC